VGILRNSILAMNAVVNFPVHGVGPVKRGPDPGGEEVWVSTEQFEAVLDGVVVRPDARLTDDDCSASDLEMELPVRFRPRNIGARAIKRIRG
jgi:hypothetical protein